MVEVWAGKWQPYWDGGGGFSGCRGGWRDPSRWAGWGGNGGGDGDDEDDPTLPELVENDDDEDDYGDGDGDGGGPPPGPSMSNRGNRGVPAPRYDEVYEIATDFMSPPRVERALGGEKG